MSRWGETGPTLTRISWVSRSVLISSLVMAFFVCISVVVVCSFVQRFLQEQARLKSACGGIDSPARLSAPQRTAGGKAFVLHSLASLLVMIGFLVMPFLRRHSNGFQVAIDRQSTAHGYLWVVYSVVEDGLVGLTASSLSEARGIADSLAMVSHVEECDDACNDWELLKRANHG